MSADSVWSNAQWAKILINPEIPDYTVRGQRMLSLMKLFDTKLLGTEPTDDEWAATEAQKATEGRTDEQNLGFTDFDDVRWQKRVLRSYQLQLEAILKDDALREWFPKRRGKAGAEVFYEDMFRRFTAIIAWLGSRNQPLPMDMNWRSDRRSRRVNA